jgi:flavodoxin
MKTEAKLTAGLLSMVLVLTGCGSTAGTSSPSASAAETAAAASPAAADADTVSGASLSVDSDKAQQLKDEADAVQSDHHVLVVYYSASSIGNTETAAYIIADELQADLFRIQPADGYDDEEINFNDADSRISQEHDNEDLQEQVELVSTTVDNWDSYDTVFIGYPIWWGQAAWTLNQFVEKNDFTGKTVVPFATSQMSGIGSSAENLAEKAGTGDWQEGQRFGEDPNEDDVRLFADQYAE